MNNHLTGNWGQVYSYSNQIDARACYSPIDTSTTTSDIVDFVKVILTFAFFLWIFSIFFNFILFVIVCFVLYYSYKVGYIIYRIGFKKTIKLFRRIDRENKRKRAIY